MNEKKDLVEIWGDVVEVKSLVFSIALSVATTMGFYFFAPSDNRTMGLFFGLFGAIVGFLISAIIIKPKRDITLEEKE